MLKKLPLIVDIARNRTEDGKGIRTTVFFKGCPLSCIWCQNPEAMERNVEIGFYPKNCIGCFECEKVCPEAAIIREKQRINRGKCTLCLRCVDACPTNSLRKIGTYYEIDELLEILLLDYIFYETSGGGITLSGGEPTLWPTYVGELLKRLKSRGIHTAIQTSGFFSYSSFKEKILPWLSLIMYDFKIIDPIMHLQYTGCDNKIILENFIKLLKEGVEVIPRIPLIPEFTDTKENLSGILEFLKKMGIERYSFLPYNPLGLSKWENLGKKGKQFYTDS